MNLIMGEDCYIYRQINGKWTKTKELVAHGAPRSSSKTIVEGRLVLRQIGPDEAVLLSKTTEAKAAA